MEPPKEDPEAPDVAPGIHDNAMRGDVDDLAAALTAAVIGWACMRSTRGPFQRLDLLDPLLGRI